jgi:hypothetical protein
MTSFRVLGFLIAALLPPVLPAQITVISGNLAFQNSNSEQSKRPLTNMDVRKMVKSGMGEQTILLAIEQGPTKFDISPEALVQLKNAGASDALLNAMLLARTTWNPQANYVAENREGCQLLRKALDTIGGPKLASIVTGHDLFRGFSHENFLVLSRIPSGSCFGFLQDLLL